MTLNSFDETNWLKQQTGKEPALVGLDFMHSNRGYNWYDELGPVNDAQTWYNKNGIPALAWHWRDPSRQTEAFYTAETSFDVSKITDENSAEYHAMISDIDYIAGLLKRLSDEGIPVLWRPLHEASGGWFWWGAKGPEACKRLWQILFNRLVNHHQINNLIWVWTTDTREDNMDWYPGDEYVDILGVDIYTEQGDFGSQYLTFDKIKADFEGKKIITLSECGIMPDPDKLTGDEAGWSWFMSWYGNFVRDGNYNPLNHWQKVLDHDYVITLDEMPNLRDYTTSVMQIGNSENFILSFDHLQQTLQIDPHNYQGNFDVEAYNLNGSCFYKKKSLQGTNRVTLYNQPKGMILVSVKTQQKRHTFKIVL
jgi:mannan endo-1,4-beta-mannosidase